MDIKTISLPENIELLEGLDIIIPLMDELDYLKRCLIAVEENTIGHYHIYIVDDGSKERETKTFLNRLRDEKITVLYNKKTKGFSGTVNTGIEVGKSKYICLLNSDSEVGTFGWDAELKKVFKKHKDVGIVGVLSNNAVNQSVLKGTNIPEGQTIKSVAKYISQISEKRYPKYNLPTGFCYTFKRDLIDRIGYIDEKWFPHYGSEDDFTMKAISKGLTNRMCDNVFVYHKAEQSYGAASPLRKMAGFRFVKRWGDVSLMASEDFKSLEYLRDKLKTIPPQKEEPKVDPEEVKFTIEIPNYQKDTSGGLERSKKLAEYLYTIEIPSYHKYTGGLNDMLHISNRFHNSHIRMQRQHTDTDYSKVGFKIPYSVGFPDKTFPKTKFAITYSDTTHLKELIALPQVEKVGIYMLSYGMVIERERPNALNKNVICMASTKRTCDLVNWDGGNCHLVGFGLDVDDIYWEGSGTRNRYITLLAHNNTDKRFDLGMKIATKLVENGFADGIVTFGYINNKLKYPNITKHYEKADRTTVRKIFNDSICFIMPSVTEGLNLTPLEATLCKCPAVLCDGALDELYFDDYTCRIAQKDNFEDLYEKAKYIIRNYPEVSETYYNNIKKYVALNTWDRVVNNIKRVMENENK